MRSPAVLLAAVLALGGVIAGRATALPPPMVNDALITGDTMPRELANFGFFLDSAGRDAAPGVIAYELNTPLWTDGADKLRYIYIPKGTQITPDGEGLPQFPVGTAIIKTFAFGEGADQRFIETRVLLHRADGWLALPYRWNEDQSGAKLALAGARIPITRPDGVDISYRIPNKNECKTCHSKDGEVTPIGPKARNLSADWLKAMADQHTLATMPEVAAYVPLWSQRDAHPDTAALARGYLDVNCAHCHQPGGGASNSGLDLRWEQDDPHAIGIRKPPVAAGRGSGGRKVSIDPGHPDNSFMLYRMESTEAGVAMPEIGRSTNDDEGIAVVRKWIKELPET